MPSCETCEYWDRDCDVEEDAGYCDSPKLIERHYGSAKLDIGGCAINSEGCESPYFMTGRLFGCVNWKQKDG